MTMMTAAMVALATVPQAAGAQVLGSDAAACTGGGGPAILARIEGLKDRKGNLKLELYPANEEDFLQDDGVLVRAGKTFRRVQVPTPQRARGSRCASACRIPAAMRCSSPMTATARTSSTSGATARASRPIPSWVVASRRSPPR